MAGDRIRRVNEALREVLSVRISEGLKDPRVGFVTVTAVDTSPDLRHARVYVSLLGDDDERAETMAGLERARGFLQAGIARELRIKHTPALVFEQDKALAHGMRIAELLDEHAPPGPALGEIDRSDDGGESTPAEREQ